MGHFLPSRIDFVSYHSPLRAQLFEGEFFFMIFTGLFNKFRVLQILADYTEKQDERQDSQPELVNIRLFPLVRKAAFILAAVGFDDLGGWQILPLHRDVQLRKPGQPGFLTEQLQHPAAIAFSPAG